MKNIKRFVCGLFGVTLAVCASAVAQESASKPRVVVMLGPPGAGKGTVAVRLADELSVPHISTGDLFRENIQGKTALGSKAKEFMDAGKLVPDELVLDMLLSRVERDDCQKGYVLDGFPRTLPQAEALGKKLEKSGRIVALNLEVADDLLVERIVNRRVCKSCGAPFHLMFKPSKKEGECDRCSGKLIQRSDDTKEVVIERLSVYHKQTEPVATFYRKQKCVIAIDGTRSPAEVFKQVQNALK